MRFMIIVKSTPEFEAETTPQMPDEKLMAAMAGFHEELAQAGVLLDASGLQPSRKGWRIHYDGQKLLEVVYLLFNEGYTATAGDHWMRAATTRRAMSLNTPRRWRAICASVNCCSSVRRGCSQEGLAESRGSLRAARRPAAVRSTTRMIQGPTSAR